jgi:hypothetical protein
MAAAGAGVVPASISTASIKPQPSRCSTSAMTSPPVAHPRQFQTCFLRLTENLSVPPHTGHGPQRSLPRPRNEMPRRESSPSSRTPRASSDAVIMAVPAADFSCGKVPLERAIDTAGAIHVSLKLAEFFRIRFSGIANGAGLCNRRR